ncbi:MAG TPA: N-acetyltransferase [Spirochaetaceae bacterium]|nr:N-acetyltransferase [Spirochaetaceae bacterium]
MNADSNIEIRKAMESDIPDIMRIYEHARKFMAENGNPNQWGKDYPPQALIVQDVESGRLNAMLSQGKIHAVFAFIIGADPSYETVEGGEWISDSPYGTMHRIASDGVIRGVLAKALEHCVSRINHIRIDTHSDSIPMQKAIEKCGFKRIGVVTVRNSHRIAYELVVGGSEKL